MGKPEHRRGSDHSIGASGARHSRGTAGPGARTPSPGEGGGATSRELARTPRRPQQQRQPRRGPRVTRSRRKRPTDAAGPRSDRPNPGCARHPRCAPTCRVTQRPARQPPPARWLGLRRRGQKSLSTTSGAKNIRARHLVPRMLSCPKHHSQILRGDEPRVMARRLPAGLPSRWSD